VRLWVVPPESALDERALGFALERAFGFGFALERDVLLDEREELPDERDAPDARDFDVRDEPEPDLRAPDEPEGRERDEPPERPPLEPPLLPPDDSAMTFSSSRNKRTATKCGRDYLMPA